MALAQGAVCVSTASLLTEEAMDPLKFLYAHFNQDKENIPQIQSLLRLIQPYWSAPGLEKLQEGVDPLKRAGIKGRWSMPERMVLSTG